MDKHSKDEILKMLKLIESSAVEIYRQLDFEKNENVNTKAKSLIKKYESNIEIILNKPQGGALAPEEIAEMIIVQDYYKNGTYEEAATAEHAY
ncbi:MULTISPECIES: hypothetical protein [Paraliobacillus]|uniref:hypothetical protein n=1 Tax=Paraliobacillus TaxID=200903 RepID=UPI000E3D1A58|nr:MULTISPECIES: hypothetical protein [Paraliobacillus]